MKKLLLTILALSIMALQPIFAVSDISLKFNRTGTDAQSVTVSVVDENGTAVSGASATMEANQSFKATTGNVTSSIICPDVNANTSPTIELTFKVNGMPENFVFNKMELDIHALNSGGNYQASNDNVVRHWNIASTINGNAFAQLNDIDIAAGVNPSGDRHQMWAMTGNTVTSNGETTIKLTITKGTTNNGCFFGLSEVKLSNGNETPAPEPEPEPEPEPAEGEGKVYLISWKNTGANYITEETDHRISIHSQDNKKPQFWMFIPTGNTNCYYIKNTATDRYIGSCNLTPSSESKIYTTTTPVEYYVAKTAATSGENANCYWFSSTDCTGYDSESAGPRALNKDGASNYVITWTAGVNNTGSYWTLVETEDLYEVSAFDASTAIGSIGASYNMESANGKNLTITNGNLALATPDSFDENQEWYFVGTGNTTGWQIASAAEPATVVGIVDGNITTGEGLTTKWKLNADKAKSGYFYFTSGETRLTVDDESLFRFTRIRSAFSRKLQIYNNPCGVAGNNYIKHLKLNGDAVYGTIVYEAAAKPGSYHVVYALDKGEVGKNESFDIDITLAENAANDLKATAYFDWNADGVFESEAAFTLNANTGKATVSVPEWATDKQTRMRVRVNSNGIDLAEDEVNGFIYDFHIKAVEPQEGRTVTVSKNSWERGTVKLSSVAESYELGTTLTATATACGTATFVCWREEGVVVSTDAEYTFTVDHNIKLVAYFTANTDESSYPEEEENGDNGEDGKDEEDETKVSSVTANDITVEQQGNKVIAKGDETVTGMTIYTVDAATVAKGNGNSLDVQNIAEGLYIVRVATANSYKNVKLYISK